MVHIAYTYIDAKDWKKAREALASVTPDETNKTIRDKGKTYPPLLHFAVLNDAPEEIVSLILDMGADINLIAKVTDTVGIDTRQIGTTAIGIAQTKNLIGIVELLKDRGAIYEVKDESVVGALVAETEPKSLTRRQREKELKRQMAEANDKLLAMCSGGDDQKEELYEKFVHRLESRLTSMITGTLGLASSMIEHKTGIAEVALELVPELMLEIHGVGPILGIVATVAVETYKFISDERKIKKCEHQMQHFKSYKVIDQAVANYAHRMAYHYREAILAPNSEFEALEQAVEIVSKRKKFLDSKIQKLKDWLLSAKSEGDEHKHWNIIIERCTLKFLEFIGDSELKLQQDIGIRAAGRVIEDLSIAAEVTLLIEQASKLHVEQNPTDTIEAKESLVRSKFAKILHPEPDSKSEATPVAPTTAISVSTPDAEDVSKSSHSPQTGNPRSAESAGSAMATGSGAPAKPKSPTPIATRRSPTAPAQAAPDPAREFQWLKRLSELAEDSPERNDLLLEASKANVVSVVRTLVKTGINVKKIKDKDGRNALMVAAQSGNIDVVRALLDSTKIDINAKDNADKTALLLATQYRHVGTAELLLDRGALIDMADKVGLNMLIVASLNGDEEMLKLCLTRGANIYAADKEGKNALMCASSRGNEGIVKLLLRRMTPAAVGVIQKDGFNALMYASWNGHWGVVAILVEEYRDVDAVNVANKYGKTALMYASIQGHLHVVMVLIKKQANINAKDKEGNSSLTLALQNGRIDVVKFLLEKGADCPDPVFENLIRAQNLNSQFVEVFIEKQEYQRALRITHKLISEELAKESGSLNQNQLIKLYLLKSDILIAEQKAGDTEGSSRNKDALRETYKQLLKLEDSYEVLLKLLLNEITTREETGQFIRELESKLEHALHDLELLKLKAMFHLLTHGHMEALSTCNVIRDNFGETPLILMVRGFALLGLKHFEDAFHAFKKIGKEDKYLTFGMAECLLGLKEYDKAMRLYSKLIQELQESEHLYYQAQFGIAKVKEHQGDLKGAKVVYSKIDLLKAETAGKEIAKEIKERRAFVFTEHDFQAHMKDIEANSLRAVTFQIQKEELERGIKAIIALNPVTEIKGALLTLHEQIRSSLSSIKDAASLNSLRGILHASESIIDSIDEHCYRLLVATKRTTVSPRSTIELLWKKKPEATETEDEDVFVNIIVKIRTLTDFIESLKSKRELEDVPKLKVLISKYEGLNNYLKAYSKEVIAAYPDGKLPELRALIRDKKPVLPREQSMVFTESLGSGYLEREVHGAPSRVSIEEPSKLDQVFGTHALVKQEGVYYKYNPYAPGIEYAVNRLAAIILTQAEREPVPHQLLKIVDLSQTKPPALILASRDMGDFTLQHILDNHPEYLHSLDMEHYANMIILSLLTSPGDGKPDNFIATFKYHEKDDKRQKLLQIIGIDNDIAFATGVVRLHKQQHRKAYTKVLNVLYCFKHMDLPVDEDFKRKFLENRYRAEEIVLEWLEALAHKNQEYLTLLDRGFDKSDLERLKVPIKLIPGTARGIYQKIRTIYKLLDTQPFVTYQQLLDALYKDVGVFYQKIRESSETTVDAITALYALRSKEEALAERLRAAKTAARARDALFSISTESIVMNPERFKAKFISSIKQESEEFLASIDFSRFEPEQTSSYLSRVEAMLSDIETLTLNGYNLEGTERLSALIDKNKSLKKIVLIECHKLIETSIGRILEKFREVQRAGASITVRECRLLSLERLKGLQARFPSATILVLAKTASGRPMEYNIGQITFDTLVKDDVRDKLLLISAVESMLRREAQAKIAPTIFHSIARMGNKEAFEAVIKVLTDRDKPIDRDKKSETEKSIVATIDDKTALDIAIENGKWEIALMLERLSASGLTIGVQASNKDRLSKILGEWGKRLVVDEIQAEDLRGVDWTSITSEQLTRFIVDKKINVNEQDTNGNTHLHLAVREGNLRKVELLLDVGADESIPNNIGVGDIDIGEHKGLSSLELAVAQGKEDIHIKILNHMPSQLWSYLERGYAHEAIAIIERMSPAKLNILTRTGESLILLALQRDLMQIVRKLAERRVNLDVRYGDKKETLLHIFIAKSKDEAIEYTDLIQHLLIYGASVGIHDTSNRDPLTLALDLKQYKIAATLMNCGARVREKREKEGTAKDNHQLLNKAANCGLKIEENDFKSFDFTKMDRDGNDLLVLSVIHNDLELFKELLPHFAGLVQKQQAELLDLLLNLLNTIAKLRRLDFFKAIESFAAGSGVQIPAYNKLDEHLFQQIENEKELVKLLHKIGWDITIEEAFFGIDANKLNTKGNTMLYELIKHRHLKGMLLLLDLGTQGTQEIDVSLTGRRDKMTPLHLAVSTNQLAIVETLLDSNARLDRYDIRGRSPLDLAFTTSSISDRIKQLLLKETLKPENWSILHESVYRGQPETVKQIVQLSPIQLKRQDDFGLKPLDYAMGAWKDVFSTYTEDKSYLSAPSKILELLKDSEHQSLQDAVEKYNVMIVQEYVRHRSATLIQSEKDEALLCAIKLKKQDMVRYLLDIGASKFAKDSKGRTTLHNAAANDDSELCLELIKYGADKDLDFINAKDESGKTALDIAIKIRSMQTVTALLHKICKADSHSLYELYRSRWKTLSELADLMVGEEPHVGDQIPQPPLPPKSHEEILREHGLIAVDTGGAGNCFFLAAADQVRLINGGNAPYDHIAIREFAVNHVREHREDMVGFLVDEEPEAYIDRMAMNGEWADNVIIRAVAQSLGLNIIIFPITVRNELRPPNVINTGSDRTIALLHITEMHYLSMQHIDLTNSAFHALIASHGRDRSGAIIEAERVNMQYALDRLHPAIASVPEPRQEERAEPTLVNRDIVVACCTEIRYDNPLLNTQEGRDLLRKAYKLKLGDAILEFGINNQALPYNTLIETVTEILGIAETLQRDGYQIDQDTINIISGMQMQIVEAREAPTPAPILHLSPDKPIINEFLSIAHDVQQWLSAGASFGLDMAKYTLQTFIEKIVDLSTPETQNQIQAMLLLLATDLIDYVNTVDIHIPIAPPRKDPDDPNDDDGGSGGEDSGDHHDAHPTDHGGIFMSLAGRSNATETHAERE